MSIGGLIFDRAMAGWDVSVVVDGEIDGAVDDRPIRILGARVAKRLRVRRRGGAAPSAHACGRDGRDGQKRRRTPAGACAGNDKETEVLLWGRHHPTNYAGTFVAARHQPSAAAHVFKSQALAAGGARRSRGPTRASTRWPDRQSGLPAVTNCKVRWICCSMPTRPDSANRSTNASRSNKRSPIAFALASVACRIGGWARVAGQYRHPTAGSQHPHHFAGDLKRFGHQIERAETADGVEGFVAERQRSRVTADVAGTRPAVVRTARVSIGTEMSNPTASPSAGSCSANFPVKLPGPQAISSNREVPDRSKASAARRCSLPVVTPLAT